MRARLLVCRRLLVFFLVLEFQEHRASFETIFESIFIPIFARFSPASIRSTSFLPFSIALSFSLSAPSEQRPAMDAEPSLLSTTVLRPNEPWTFGFVKLTPLVFPFLLAVRGLGCFEPSSTLFHFSSFSRGEGPSVAQFPMPPFSETMMLPRDLSVQLTTLVLTWN